MTAPQQPTARALRMAQASRDGAAATRDAVNPYDANLEPVEASLWETARNYAEGILVRGEKPPSDEYGDTMDTLGIADNLTFDGIDALRRLRENK